MKRVFVASPYAGDIRRNEIYARAAMRDALSRGEAPLAPHLLYTQVLPEDGGFCRNLGIDAGKAFLAVCEVMTVYEDFGVSSGMKGEIALAEELGVPVERRSLREWREPYPVFRANGSDLEVWSDGILRSHGEPWAFSGTRSIELDRLEKTAVKNGDVVFADRDRFSVGNIVGPTWVALCDWPPVRFGEK